MRNVRNYLKSFGKKVVSQAKNTLKQSDKNVSGTLLNSINYEVKENAGEFIIEFKMSDYGQFVEKNLTDDLNENSNTKYKEYSNGIKILFELLLGFLIGGFLGYYLDIMLATTPVFLLIGIFLGGISGIYTIWKKNIYDKINESD